MKTEGSNSSKMARLLGRLKVEMNGAVSESMSAKGIIYHLNYGVSIPTIRNIAEGYYPDHSFAKLLYLQQVRELKLAAIMIADPSELSVSELDFWAEGIDNIEVAEQIASVLLGNAGTAPCIVSQVLNSWLSGDNALLKYSALLTAAKKLDTYTFKDLLSSDVFLSMLKSDNKLVWQGTAILFSRLLINNIPGSKDCIKQILIESEKRGCKSALFLKEEVAWLLE